MVLPEEWAATDYFTLGGVDPKTCALFLMPKIVDVSSYCLGWTSQCEVIHETSNQF